jgi:2-polyprenyl-3-methyl-5-hydroxy-6-metoxy-1,4-benzoquinol methylase
VSTALPARPKKAERGPLEPAYDVGGCPICGTLQSIEIANRDAIKREIELNWEFHESRLRQPVPPDHLIDRLVFSQAPPLRLASCAECHHLYRNPRENGDALERSYAEALHPAEMLETLFQNQRLACRAQVKRILRTGARIHRGLEVGSYVGAFLAAAADAALPFEGIDVNSSVTEFAATKDLPAETGSLEDLPLKRKYDAIVIWNTFEQLPDVRAATVRSHELLREGGLLAVRIPNGAFYEKWRRRLGGPMNAIAARMLAHNNLLGFPYRQGFSESSMKRLLTDCRFEIIATKGDTLFPIADRWTTSRGVRDERFTKGFQRLLQRGWSAPWVEIYAKPI